MCRQCERERERERELWEFWSTNGVMSFSCAGSARDGSRRRGGNRLGIGARGWWCWCSSTAVQSRYTCRPDGAARHEAKSKEKEESGEEVARRVGRDLQMGLRCGSWRHASHFLFCLQGVWQKAQTESLRQRREPQHANECLGRT